MLVVIKYNKDYTQTPEENKTINNNPLIIVNFETNEQSVTQYNDLKKVSIFS